MSNPSTIAYPQTQCRLNYSLALPGQPRIEGREQFTSEQGGPAADRRYRALPEPQNSPRAGERLHEHDAEVKAVNYLVGCVVDAYQEADDAWADAAQELTGEVELAGSQGPCHSCRRVIRLISRDMPQVTFTVTYTARNIHIPVVHNDGTKVSLYGQYGYRMAALSESGTSWGVQVKGGVETGYSVPKRGFPQPPPGW